jgi:flagellar protein FliS
MEAMSMETIGFQAYKEQTVNTMTQGEQLLLLYDELIKRLTRAELAMDKQDYAAFDASVERGIDIIHYLNSILDRQYEISKNLAQLYEYFTYELRRVKVGRNRTELTRVKKMASELRESFQQANKKSASER